MLLLLVLLLLHLAAVDLVVAAVVVDAAGVVDVVDVGHVLDAVSNADRVRAAVVIAVALQLTLLTLLPAYRSWLTITESLSFVSASPTFSCEVRLGLNSSDEF